ncbi:PCNA-associated factor isoform X2 [Camelus dromedarius]|uniref:PCNA-associated factor isoform X2 n=1 Tax=Camelus dromedarius TaxID=9838 RepID=UPI00311A53C6
MVRTKADGVPGTYRKVVASRAPRKVLGSSTSANNSTSFSSRKENKYAGGNPVCVRPTPKWQKGIGEFFRLSPKDSEKENRISEEAGSSGLGKAKRKSLPCTSQDPVILQRPRSEPRPRRSDQRGQGDGGQAQFGAAASGAAPTHADLFVRSYNQHTSSFGPNHNDRLCLSVNS